MAPKPKWYGLIEFPYPSGAGLHVGHVRSYTALDIVSRKKRMEGFNVLYPIGWDAFGLPTENYAIKNKIHPRRATEQNVTTFKRQLTALGLSFDWSREINTTDPQYYKWTQWIFVQLFKNNLAYQAEMPINWCPNDKIGLANEEVVEGKCERCGTNVTKKKMKQWMLKITAYADRLIDDLATVDYPKKIKAQQINWIGRSEGVVLQFLVKGRGENIEVFTTRPDTLFGATYIVLAPEHPLVESITAHEQKQSVRQYQSQTAAKSDCERTELAKDKTGVVTGAFAVNPANGQEIPIWVADYVLSSYGTGAIMAVPAHDERDFDFAKKYALPIVRVISDTDTMENSAQFNGLPNHTARPRMIAWLVDQGSARVAVHYKLRDWVFSRQHYWGEPIPIVHCDKCGATPVPEDQLPVELPNVEHYEPTETGASPLAAMTAWVNISCPQCGGVAKRETDTMPNWAGSSWYFLRYTDPYNAAALADPEKLNYWMPVDLYNGGFEHTTLHVLYSRFWHKFLFDIGAVSHAEPYLRRRSHGIVLGPDGRKMSKSFGNVINPDDIIAQYGADTLRIYEMFMGPFEEMIAWDEHGVKGARKFLDRVWRLRERVVAEAIDDAELARVIHCTIKKVTEDIDAMKFNTAVAQLMICVNAFEKTERIPQQSFEDFLKVFSVFAPHLAEELWQMLGYTTSITQEPWPTWDAKMLQQDEVTIAVQVNGKLRGTLVVAAHASEDDVRDRVEADEKIAMHIGAKKIVKFVYVPGHIVSIVTTA